MKSTVSEPKSWQKIIDVELSVEEVDSKYKENVKKYRKEVKLPGFRQGKVPASIIESRFGAGIREESIDQLLKETYQKVLADEKIIPVSEGKVTDFKVEDGQPVVAKFEVEIDPEIEIKDYKKVKVKVSPKKITDSDVEKMIEELREKMSDFSDVDGESRDGDFVLVNYDKVIVDGELKESLNPAPQVVEIGNGIIKDFDKELTGVKKGDIKTFTFKFPEGYQYPEVAGREAEITVSVDGVKKRKLPEIDESFLKAVGDFESLDALKDRIRKDLEENALQVAKTEAYEKAIDQILEKNDFEIPPARVEYYIRSIAEEQAKQEPNGMAHSIEDVRKEYSEMAVRDIKKYRIIDFIAKKEKIKATQEEVDEEIRKIAESHSMEFDKVKSIYRQNGTTLRIRQNIQERKTLDALIGELPWPEDKK